MRINTKTVFEWNSDTEQYEEIYSEGYEYEGEVDLLQQSDQIYFPSKFSRGEGYAEMTAQQKKEINPRYLGGNLADEDIDWRNVPFDKSRIGMPRDMVKQWELLMGYDRPQGDRLNNPQKAVTEARRYLQRFIRDNPGGENEQREGRQVIQDIRDEVDWGFGYVGHTINADAEEMRKIKGSLEIMEQFPDQSNISYEQARMMDFPPRYEQDIRRTTDDRIFDLLPEDEGIFPEGDTKSTRPGE